MNNSTPPTRGAVEQLPPGELVCQQEQKTAAILQKYHREFVPTVRDGNCFYDGMSKVRSDTSIMKLRERSYLEGKKCLAGKGKLQFDAARISFFREQIEQLRHSRTYAEQIDLRLMAATENCRIVVCDLDEEKVLSVVGPEGELEEYPKKTLSEVMSQDPETELFLLDTQGKHYMTGRKRFNGNQQPVRNSSNEYQPLEPSPSVVPPPPLLSSTTTPKPSRAQREKLRPQRQAVRSSQVNAASDTVKTSRNQKPERVTSNECQQPRLTCSTEFPPTIAELIAREMDQRRVVIDDSPDKSESPNDSDWDES
ncbi:OTU domain-containing protein [Endozoicomonas sp. ONNA2]|uniref:OTU domain-containing protein n=1 Tax=Endozoicomonas sp. ONNA2 TaxID=2828741 RepID=UPI0021490720|nr:OTU domain-containing protein [Endozoicomonas sp. ONNA2]